MFIELHMIQSFAPSNLNRDDTNNPKDCEFGGHRRARISSQSLKRAIRYEPVFAGTTKAQGGERSKWLTRPLIKVLMDAGKPEKDAHTVAKAFVAAYAGKMDKKKADKTSVLIYFSRDEINLMTSELLQSWDKALAEARGESKNTLFSGMVKRIIKETANRTSAPDIALFGRMLADKPQLNIDAACQVAHAISTHRVSMEMDFYTAVDDLQNTDEEEGAGAGMMGFTSFNSACFYRYARIDWGQLVTNLGGDQDLARRTVEGFLRAAIIAIPTGKQNSFAAQNPTNFALAVVRTDGMSWSLANAFETPVHSRRDTGLIAPSLAALDAYWNKLVNFYGDEQIKIKSAFAIDHEEELTSLKINLATNRDQWVTRVTEALAQEV